jgi:cephalosporin hydroxylase
MKLILDTDAKTLIRQAGKSSETYPLYSREAFEILSREWVKVGWNQKYTYTFSWLGRPIIQLPEDMIRVQEAIYRIQPDWIVETGIAHGGSLIFYAGLCKIMGKGRVLGVDIDLRPHNRKALQAHELAKYIEVIDGSSIDPGVVEQVHSRVGRGASALVLLDSNHTKDHVLAELDAYYDLVTPNSYIVATDGIMADLSDVPRGKADWKTDNPLEAAREFAAGHPEFRLEIPSWPFNESELEQPVTHWPGAWLRRLPGQA